MQERGLEERDNGAPATKMAQMLGKDKAAGGVGGRKGRVCVKRILVMTLKTPVTSGSSTLVLQIHWTAGAVRSHIALPDTCMLSRHIRVMFNLYQGSENLVLGSKMVSGLVCRFIFKALNLNLFLVVVSCHQKANNPWNLHLSPPAPLPLMV